MIYANDHDGHLPPVAFAEGDRERPTTIHDVVMLLALHGGLDHAEPWFCPSDPALSGQEQHFDAVLNHGKTGLSTLLAKQQVFSYDYVTGLTVDAWGTTPIAWTRGLREDGRWDREGVYTEATAATSSSWVGMYNSSET